MIMLLEKPRKRTFLTVWVDYLTLPAAVRRAKIKLARQKRRPNPKLP